MLVYLYNPQPLQRTLYMVRCSLQPRRHQRHSGNIKNTHYWQYVTHNVQRRRPRRAREQRCRRVVFVRQCLRFPETSCNRRQWHAWSPWDDQSVPCTHCWQTDRQLLLLLGMMMLWNWETHVTIKPLPCFTWHDAAQTTWSWTVSHVHFQSNAL